MFSWVNAWKCTDHNLFDRARDKALFLTTANALHSGYLITLS